jgi:hypothetical protein
MLRDGGERFTDDPGFHQARVGDKVSIEIIQVDGKVIGTLRAKVIDRNEGHVRVEALKHRTVRDENGVIVKLADDRNVYVFSHTHHIYQKKEGALQHLGALWWVSIRIDIIDRIKKLFNE